MSELNELAAALAKAQGEIMPAPKDAANPYFKSKYASLPAVREAVREVFAKHGLSVVQMPEVDVEHVRDVEVTDNKGEISIVHLGQLRMRTLLLHSSGQSLDCGVLSAEIDLANPQKIGSAITYFRRYALAAISQTVADEDDDANAASHAPVKRRPPPLQLTGHDVVALQQEINDAPTVEALGAILKGDTYKRLKSAGPEDVYTQTSNLAKAKHAILTNTDEQEPAKPF